VLSTATLHVQLTEEVEQRARELQALGFKPLDAAHLACAEAAHADFFCTCDDRLLKRAKALIGPGTRVVSPIELTEELEHDD
jgi:predicted nucleic acid-binding protein